MMILGGPLTQEEIANVEKNLGSQPGKEKGHDADRPSEDTARTPRVSLEGRRTSPRGGRKVPAARKNGLPRPEVLGQGADVTGTGTRRTGGEHDSIQVDVPKPGIDQAQYGPHRPDSNWLYHMCDSCIARRKRAGIEVGEIPTKREKRYGKK